MAHTDAYFSQSEYESKINLQIFLFHLKKRTASVESLSGKNKIKGAKRMNDSIKLWLDYEKEKNLITKGQLGFAYHHIWLTPEEDL